MINDKAILVGVDGSHASYKATWWAANYAKHAGLTLQIVCAYSLPSSPAEVPTKSLEEIAGVEEIPVSAAEPEVAQQIEKTIDPDRQ